MNSYLNERKKKKRRRTLKIKIFCSVAVFLALVIGAVYLTVYSEFFTIRNIEVGISGSDNGQINEDDLIRDLESFFSSQSEIASLLGADNILIWNAEKLNEFPRNLEVAKINMEKDFLERKIKIEVKKRERFGIWCLVPTNNEQQTTDNCYWFDESGVIFKEAPQAEGNLIKKVDDFSGRSLKPGDSVLNENFLSNLIGIFRVLEESGLTIKSLKLGKLEFQEVITESSPEIHFSLRISPQFALTALESMKNVGLDKIEYIDLTVENRVYYKLLTK